MKKIGLLFITALFVVSISGAAQAKALVAYFSWSGNTEIMARTIFDRLKERNVDADLFVIETATPYPVEYRPTTVVARQEQDQDARPALATRVENMAQYNTIFLGYPIWRGTLPMAEFTFLEKEGYDFSGKRIISFNTHERSGAGRGVEDIRRLAPNATVEAGLVVRGKDVIESIAKIQEWVDSLENL